MPKNHATPLHREDVARAVERRNPPRIPLVRACWWGEGLEEQYGERLLGLQQRHPDDVVWMFASPSQPEDMGLSWSWEQGAHDARIVFDDWSRLDEFIEKLPRPETDPRMEKHRDKAARARAEDRYVLFGWWRLLFERGWGLRGMENLMVDFYEEPDNVHRMHAGLTETYCRYIRHASQSLGANGFWTSDDLGHQTGPMMSPALFREFYLPYYKRIAETVRACGMHFWLHSCGDNTLLLPDLADAGVTVFHPVQKGTMDEKKTAAEFGGRLAFLAGIDVQHILQEADPEGVRREVRHLIDTFDRPDGGMCIAAGNGIVAGTPFENIEAFLDEATSYGAAHRKGFVS